MLRIEAELDRLEREIVTPRSTERSDRSQMYSLTSSLDSELGDLEKRLEEVMKTLNERQPQSDAVEPIIKVIAVMNQHNHVLLDLEKKLAVLEGKGRP